MPRRHKHSLTNYKLLSCNAGQLVPIGIQEVLPGDIFQHRTSALVRAAQLNAPVMHPFHVRIHHWYVPTRLVWPNFSDKFITGGPDGNDNSVHPTIAMTYTAGTPDTGNNQRGFIPDYLGVPPEKTGFSVSALPFRALVLIFNEWYRDQDLVSKLALSTADGVDATTYVGELPRIAWEKDRFTSARLTAQKGTGLTLPLGDSAPVVLSSGFPVSTNPLLKNRSTGALSGSDTVQSGASGELRTNSITVPPGVVLDPNGTLEADLSQATGVDINTVREFFALQRFMEARSRYGSRYTEYLAFYGIRSSDARLQRPEYLGGGKQTIQFSEVLSTNEDADGEQAGVLRGHGIAASRSNRYRRHFEEHGFVISLMSIRPKSMYVDGLHPMFFRATKEDYWQRELEGIGQAVIYNKEVKVDHADPDGVFGYQDRYDEYRRAENSVAGEMRDVLNFWHAAREFSGDPALNAAFVTCTPTDRIFAAGEEIANQFLVMAHHSLQTRRLVSKVGNSFIM